MTKREDTIQMSVGGLTLDPVTKTPIVILKDTENKLNLPIWIGLLEATAMATEIEGIKMARPMTHDLLKNILGEVGCSVESIEITDRFAAQRRHRAGATDQESDLRRQSGSGSFQRSATKRRGKRSRCGKRFECLQREMGRDSRKDEPGRLQIQAVACRQVFFSVHIPLPLTSTRQS